MSEPIVETFTDERGNISVRASQDVQVLTREEADRIAAEYKRLKAENVKLRELVMDMFDCIRYANEQDWFYFESDKPGCGMSCVVNGEGCGLSVFADRMRELGVEVDS